MGDAAPRRGPLRYRGRHGILVIAGPTAAGKTAAALQIACLWGARLISADAVQVYRGMDVGSGKVPPCVLRRFPHDCLDVRDPGEPYSAADFADDADAAIAEAAARDQPVVIAGGTAFYLRALLDGIAPAPPADPALRAALEALPDPHFELIRVDPELASKLHPNDTVRVVRGLEVHRLTGRTLSDIQHEHQARRPRHIARRLWLDREDLDARIDRRVLRMIARGYVAEVQRLLDGEVDRGFKPMRSLGYRHLADHLLDGLPLEEAIWRTQRDSRRFARKQRNFLRGLGGFEQLDARDRAAALRAAAETFGGAPGLLEGDG